MAVGRAEFKRLMGNVAAVVLIGGVLMFTFTGCANKDAVETTAPVAVETVVEEPKEVKDTTTTSGFLDNTQETQVTEKVAEREVTVTYEDSDTEAETKTVVGDEQAKFIIKDYKMRNFLKVIQEVYTNFSYDENDNTLHYGRYKVADNCEFDEDGRLIVKELNCGVSEMLKPVVKYLKQEDGTISAKYIAFTKDENVKSGLTFVIDINEETGGLEVVEIRGAFDEDVSNLPAYEGQFKGWSLTDGGEIAFESGEEALISAGLTLYPIFEYEESETTPIDGCEVYAIGYNEETGSYYLKDAGTDITVKSSLTGKEISKETVKEKQDTTKKKDNTDKSDKTGDSKDKTDKTDKTGTSKDKTGGNGGTGDGSNGSSSDESKPKPDSSGDGGNVADDLTQSNADAIAAWGAAGYEVGDGTWTGMDDLTPGALTSDMVE